jgi:hypothetical protein
MAIKNKNIKSINIKRDLQPEIQQNIVVDNVLLETEEGATKKVESFSADESIKEEMLSLKKALLSVYNKLRVYTTRNYINYKNNNFIESDSLLGFKNEDERITIKAELLDVNNTLCNNKNITIIIKKNNEDFNDYVLLEKTSLQQSNKIVFQTKQTKSCTFQIYFYLLLENNETIEFSKEVCYNAYNKIKIGYLDRHTKQYNVIENEDIEPVSSCKGNTYEIKLYKLPITKNNHGERVCLFIPQDIYNNDNGEYNFMCNNFQMPLFFEEQIKLNNEIYNVFLSTSYYENNKEIYDFSIKIKVV